MLGRHANPNSLTFQGIMILIQNLPTHAWNDQQICELTADAYSLMQVFHGASRVPQTLTNPV